MLRRSLDLIILMLYAIAAVALAFAGLSTGLPGLVLGLPLALFLPGYALTTAFLPAPMQEQPNRLLCSLGLSFAVTILIGLLLNLTPAGFQPYSWAITLGAVSFFAALVALARRWRESTQGINPRPLPRGSYRFTFGNAVILMAAGLVVVGAYMVTRTATLQQQYPGFTQLWLLRAGSTDQKSVLVGVRNMEDVPVNYRVELTVGTTLVAQWQSMTLQDGEEWQQVISLANQQIPNGDEVVVNLYRLDDPQTVYRRAGLYLQ